MPDASGRVHSLASILNHGPAILAFFKTTCPTCYYTFPFLERLHDSPAATRLFAISQDPGPDTREFLDELGCTFPALLDDRETYSVSNAYGVAFVPSIVVVEQDGRVAQSWHGWVRADMETLARRLSRKLFRDGESVPAWKAG